MTEQTFTSQISNSFEERLAIMTEELELAIRWQRPTLLMVAHGSEYVRADFLAALENSLIDLDQRVIWIHMDDPAAENESLDNTAEAVFFVDGLTAEWLEKRNSRSTLNYYRNLWAAKNARVVLWLTHGEISLLAHRAPEFWASRNRVLDLTEAPKPEQILRNALESAWQGTGEYSGRFEDTEEKISLRESFLTELPRNPESTGTRANLLLTLGVLHWRKGEFEKAEELLHKALEAATRMQDSWFEAECYNALALVKSSAGKNDEAIDAYKQAIRMAPDQIFAWNNLGNLCLKIQRNDEAMFAFQKAIEHNASDAVAWNGLGDVYSRIGYVDDAIAAYRKSIEHGPMFPHPWNGLGDMYARTGRTSEAVSAFQAAIQLNQNFVSAWVGLAKLQAKQENYREAVKAYRQALSLDPKNSSLWNELGTVHFNTSRYHEAVDAFLRAIELDRTSASAYSNLGLAHYTYGKVQDSVDLYLKSLDLFAEDKDKAVTWNRLANSYRMLNDYGKAIQAYQQADALQKGSAPKNEPAAEQPQADPISEADRAPQTESGHPVEERQPDPVEVTAPQPEQPGEQVPYWILHPAETTSDQPASLSGALHEIGGISLQLPLFSKAGDNSYKPEPAKKDSTNAAVWNEKGNVHVRAGEYDEAIYAYEKAIKLDPSCGWSYCNLGFTYLLLDRYAEAILLLQKSIELLTTNGDRAVAWNGLGNLYRRLNDYDNAVVAYQKADELDPENAGVRDDVQYFHAEPNSHNAQVWNELGDLFFKSGSYAEAANCYTQAIEMEPLNGQAFSDLALCLTYQSKYQDAIPLYLKSIELFPREADKAASWNRLGNVYRKLNDYDNAVAAYQNAVKLNDEQMALVTRARFSLLGNCYVD